MTSNNGFNDLQQFFEQWPASRDVVRSLSQSQRVTREEREILDMMQFIVDRVGPRDLED